jgi:hypothetical protein
MPELTPARGYFAHERCSVGMNVLSLDLTLHRTGNAGIPLSIGLMCAGTALVFFGLFAGNSSVVCVKFSKLGMVSERG